MSEPSIEQEYCFKIKVLPSPPLNQSIQSEQPQKAEDGAIGEDEASGKQQNWEDVYYQKVNEFYKAVESLKQKSSGRRIRPQVTQYLFYMGSQILIMMLKYLILNERDSLHYRTYVELFSIAVFAGFTYFYAVQTYQFGLSNLLQLQFHLDMIQLSCVICMIVGQYFIGKLGMSAEHTLAFRITYPLWVFYQGSTVRIQVSLYRCNRFQTLTAKLLLLAQFILTLTTLAHYSYGGLYKELIGSGAKMVSYLFLIAHALTITHFYQLYSQFDGTNCLRYDFMFQNSLQAKIRTQIKHLKKKLLSNDH